MNQLKSALMGLLLVGAVFVSTSSIVLGASGGPTGGGGGGPNPNPPPQAAGNLIVDTGSAYHNAVVTGDIISSAITLGNFTLGGIAGVPFSGTAPSTVIAGQFWCTDGLGNYVVCTNTTGVPFGWSGTPGSGTVLPQSIKGPLSFNADFASSTGVEASNASCGTSPGSTATWNISCGVSGTWTQIGTVALGTTCVQTSGHSGTGVTFATTSHTSKTCDSGRLEAVAADANNGANPVILLVGHK